MRSFGASAPLKDVLSHFGFTGDKVAATTLGWLAAQQEQAAALKVSPFGLLPTHLDAPAAKAHH